MGQDKFEPLLNNINEGRVAQASLDFLASYLEKVSASVDVNIYRKMKSGDLDSDDLLMAYAEKYAYHNLMNTLKQSVRKGQTAGAEYKKLTEEKPNGRGPSKSVSPYRGV